MNLNTITNIPTLFNRISSYLTHNENDIFNNVINQHHQTKILIQGQVQSGKTAKIIEYIKQQHKYNLPFILHIQNSLTMLHQCENALRTNKIKFHSVSNPNYINITQFLRHHQYNWKLKDSEGNHTPYVILLMSNVYRKAILNNAIRATGLKRYQLIIDESDLYFDELRYGKLYKNAHTVIHVTATPYLRAYNNYFHKIIHVQPKPNYLSISRVKTHCFNINPNDYNNKCLQIIERDFVNQLTGMMLINIYSTIDKMTQLAKFLMKHLKPYDIPVVLLSTESKLFYENSISTIKESFVPKIIDKFQDHSNIILIAHRFASRGINYVSSDYSCELSHQITTFTSKTSLIQKCRILGNKNSLNNGNSKNIKVNHSLYILNYSETEFSKFVSYVSNFTPQIK